MDQNKACGYTLQCDHSDYTPIHYLSFILKYAVPKSLVWNNALMNIIQSHGYYNVQSGERAKNIKYAGSTAEGLAIPEYFKGGPVKADIDKLIVCYNTEVCETSDGKKKSGAKWYIESSPDLPPNYAYIARLEDQEIIGQSYAPIQKQYLSNKDPKEEINRRWTNAEEIAKQLSEKEQGLETLGTITVHGPAVSIENPFAGDRDEVAVLFFPGWPDAAREWPKRKRAWGWPSMDTIDRIVAGGFYTAGVGRSKAKMHEYEWRYSFNFAEKLLAHSLTICQRQVYVYLKLFRKFYLNEPSVFPSYWLKTFFFWTCENLPTSVFTSENLAQILLHLFDELIHITSVGNLSNYFIRDVNMLERVSREHRASLLKNLRYVKANLLECVIRIDADIIFFNMVREPNEKLSVLLSECVKTMQPIDLDANGFIRAASVGLKRLLRYCSGYLKELDDILAPAVYLNIQKNIISELCSEILVDLWSFWSWLTYGHFGLG